MSLTSLQSGELLPNMKKLSRQSDTGGVFAITKVKMELGPIRASSEIQLGVNSQLFSGGESDIMSSTGSLAIDPSGASLPKMKKIRLDVNKVRKAEATTPTETSSGDTKQKNFRNVVKKTMIVRNWMMPPTDPPEIQENTNIKMNGGTTTVFEPPSVAADDAPILIEPHDIIPESPSGLKVAKSWIIDKFMRFKLFAVSPSGNTYYYWTFLVSIGVFYNMLAMVIFIFQDVYTNCFWKWIHINTFFDTIYLMDMFISSRKIYMYEGEEVKNLRLLRKNYKFDPAPIIGTVTIKHREFGGRFLLDLFCLFPLDVFLFYDNTYSLLRLPRILKVHRMVDFVEITLKQTRYPHAMKILFMMLTCYILFHINACVYFLFSVSEGLSEKDPGAFGFSYYKVFNPSFPTCSVFTDKNCLMKEDYDTLDLRDTRNNTEYMIRLSEFWKNKSLVWDMGNFSREYSMSMYWSALTITTCGQQPFPSSSSQNMLEVVDTLIGVLVFATIIGSVGNVVTQMSQAINEYRLQMDAIKLYMNYRAVSDSIQDRVLTCFMYMNSKHQLTDEKDILECLPPRMQGSLADDLHLETLSGVALFKNCGTGFLQDVVLRMKQQVFMPNDVLCKVGDKAKEMFIVKSGILHVVDDSNNFLEEITDGSTFGEMCVIQIKGNPLGDKRQHGLRSVGYSDVYILSQDDVLPLLSEYPEERTFLTDNARQWLHENEILPEVEVGRPTPHVMVESAAIFSLDEQLDKIQTAVQDMENQLSSMYTTFRERTSNMKQRLTNLEETVWYGRDQIRRDLFLGKL